MNTIAELVVLRSEKATLHEASRKYYDSKMAPRYLNKRMRDFFLKNPHYTRNWMAIVVDAVRNKLELEGFTVGDDDKRAEALNSWWDSRRMAQIADAVHEYAHSCGEAVLIGEAVNDQPRVYLQDPSAVVIVYDNVDPLRIVQAAKFFVRNKRHMLGVWAQENEGDPVIYAEYEGDTESTTGKNSKANSTTKAAIAAAMTYTSTSDEPLLLPWDSIPVWHFRRSMLDIKPEFHKVTDLQDSINKTFTAQGYTIDAAATKQRWAITDADLSVHEKLGPGDILTIPPGETGTQNAAVGEFAAEDLRQFGDCMTEDSLAIAMITQTPLQYFSPTAGTNLSGEALQAMESPLVSKVRRYQRMHAPVWEDMAAWVLTVLRQKTNTGEVTANYADPRTKLAAAQASERQMNVAAGIPIEWQLRQEGVRESEIDKLREDRDAAAGPADETVLQLVYDQASAKAAARLEPMLQQALSLISEAAINKLADPAVLQRLGKKPAEAEA